MARRRNYYSSSNSALGGCSSIIAFIIIAVMAIAQWIKENPVLTIIIVVGILAVIFFIIYLLRPPAPNNFQQMNMNSNRNSNYNQYNHDNYSDNFSNNYQQNYGGDIDGEDSSFEPNEEEHYHYQNTSYQTTNQNNAENFVINIATCTIDEILTLDGFNAEKAERFINDRDNGKMWYDIDTFVQDFGLQPHEMIMIQDRIKFPDKPKNRYGRKIDI